MAYSKQSTRVEDNYRVFTGTWFKGKCAVCGDSFKASSSSARYCSQRCKNDAAITRKKAKALEKRAAHSSCSVCGEPIQQTLSKVRKYCGAACKQAAYRASVTK